MSALTLADFPRPPHAPRKPRHTSDRRPPLRHPEQAESIAQTARLVEQRVVQLRDALVDTAKRGGCPKVSTYIREQGWQNEGAIRARFVERYGLPAKSYALAFGPCPDCECVAICSTCEHCVERAKVQGCGR